MKFRFLAVSLVLTGTTIARSFTDVSGKTIEADFVSLADGTVTISRDGKPFKLPLARFSKPDQDFIAEAAKAPAPTPAVAASGKLQLAGKELKRDGSVNIVEAPLTEETLKKTRKNKDITGIRVGVALPAGFDPAAPQKVLWVSAPINSDAERTAGNLDAMNSYASTATAAGWVVVAADCNLGNPRKEDNEAADLDMPIQHQAVAMLAAAWPGFKQSGFACAGFSGGSKASFYRVGQLAAADLNVIGLFLGGCNQNLTEGAKGETKVRGGALRAVNVFVSSGTKDEIATVAAGQAVADAIDKEFGEVKLETFDGGHSLSQPHLKTALTWFSQAGKAKGK